MEEQNNFQGNRHTVLLDISLFVLDMLSPEKIRNKYTQQDDSIVLEVPSAFITMIVDAQAGNLLLKQFINANIVAVKNNPIHKQSKDPKVQELVNATDEKLEEIKAAVQKTILIDFAPLIKDISKADQLTRPSEGLQLDNYPIQVYEPLIPVSQKDLQTLRLAYGQELQLLPHPLFDLYFLQIYHAQAATLGKRRELLSVGLATYKTIKVWRHRLFGHALNEYDDELKGEKESKEAQIEDASKELLRFLVTNYFRKEWKSIIDDVTGLTAELALTVARTGGIGLGGVAIEVVTLYAPKLVAKGIIEGNVTYVIAGLFLLLFVCLFTAPEATKLLTSLLPSPTPAVVIPKIIITVSDASLATFTLSPTQEVASSPLPIIETPTLITVSLQSVNQSIDTGYCMYVIQSGDSIQSVASRFQAAENDLRYYGKQVTLDIFEVNRMIEVNAPCCRQNDNMGSSYTVQYGDDLYSISRQFSTTEVAIASVNNLHSPSYIQTGQMLCIPFP